MTDTSKEALRLLNERMCAKINCGGTIMAEDVADMLDAIKALRAERDADRIEALEAENARLREALKPFAFLEDASVQEAWELRYQDRFRDWIDFGDMEAARAALEGGE